MINSSIFQQCIHETNATSWSSPYRGKVRDVYTINSKTLGIVATDRISAFDFILDKPIPFKGQILNTLSKYFFDQIEDIIPTHIIDVPHPNVTIAKKCEALPVEVVVRGYLTGHALRTYNSGKRILCGIPLPEGMKMNQKFEQPILTPTTKAMEGHDEDISRDEIIKQNILSEDVWNEVESYALKLFGRGTQIANKRGLILVDTKYEFGFFEDKLHLIDEVHTPDSSRYFYADEYQYAFENEQPQKQLSKEFVREWLMSQGFDGKTGLPPSLPDDFRIEVYEKYRNLFTLLTEQEFSPTSSENFNQYLEALFYRYK